MYLDGVGQALFHHGGIGFSHNMVNEISILAVDDVH